MIGVSPAYYISRFSDEFTPCDFGYENLSLRPGAGSIDWPGIPDSPAAAGYRESFDIEIICPPEAVRQEYREGRVFIETILNRIEAGSESSDLSG